MPPRKDMKMEPPLRAELFFPPRRLPESREMGRLNLLPNDGARSPFCLNLFNSPKWINDLRAPELSSSSTSRRPAEPLPRHPSLLDALLGKPPPSLLNIQGSSRARAAGKGSSYVFR